MTTGERGTCAACSRTIDDTATLCPFCGANPLTGERSVDTQALLQEVFQPRSMSTSENVLEYARQRQGVVITISIIVGFLVLAGLHQFVTMRNERVVSDSPAIPLTELTDVAFRTSETPLPVPDLDFQYDGRPRAMQTFIVERGAVAPAPPPVAAATTTAPASPAPGQAPPAAARPQAAPPRPVTRSPR